MEIAGLCVELAERWLSCLTDDSPVSICTYIWLPNYIS